VRGKCSGADKYFIRVQEAIQVARCTLEVFATKIYSAFFIIEQINNVAFTIEKQTGLRIRNVFNISLFRPFIEGKVPRSSKVSSPQ
jgi:hypothetical protein